MSKSLALDLDSTLAASMERVFDHIDADATIEDVESWEWPIERFGADRFLGGFDDVWSNHWHTVEPMEDDIAETVDSLSIFANIDIVTAQPDSSSVTHGKKAWLDVHEIPYNEFVTVPRDKSKAGYDYSVYIDDKPSLPEQVDDATVYLLDRPYNRDAQGEFTRVESVEEAMRHFVFGTTVEDPKNHIITHD